MDACIAIAVGLVMFFLHCLSLTGIFRDRILTTHDPFYGKWPPISDEEFLRRCPPGTDPRVALGVRRIVAEQLGYPYDQIYPEQKFVRDLGCC